jgi:hypothetical protein
VALAGAPVRGRRPVIDLETHSTLSGGWVFFSWWPYTLDRRPVHDRAALLSRGLALNGALGMSPAASRHRAMRFSS